MHPVDYSASNFCLFEKLDGVNVSLLVEVILKLFEFITLSRFGASWSGFALHGPSEIRALLIIFYFHELRHETATRFGLDLFQTLMLTRFQLLFADLTWEERHQLIGLSLSSHR